MNQLATIHRYKMSLKNIISASIAKIISGAVGTVLIVLARMYRDEVAAHITQADNILQLVDIYSILLILLLSFSIYLTLKSRKSFIRLKYRKHPEHQYWIHKITNKPFCPACLAAPKYYENQLSMTEDNFWCESDSCNYHKPVNPSDFYPDNDSGESPLNMQF